jgi:N-methylhydantoinase A/oxoprolinase/acetone carboxylase beta subunit
MNFSYPDVRSIGIGGGSIVRRHGDGSLTIGPDSVGYQLPQKAIVFGVDVATATDYIVLDEPKSDIGNRALVLKTDLEQNLSDSKQLSRRRLIELSMR